MTSKGFRLSLLRPSKSIALAELSTSSLLHDNNSRRTQSVLLPESAIPAKTYPADAASYELQGECGRGATGTVYKALCKPLNEIVAVKIMDLDDANARLDRAAHEATSMKFYNHPNILELYCSFVHDHELWLVVPYLDCGSCLDIIERSYKQGLDEVVIATVIKEVLKALEYIHKCGGLHRDVKAGNIIIGSDGSVKLADFGLCGHMPRAKHWASHNWDEPEVVGTPCWMAPEVVQHVNRYDAAADVWSLGITIIELAQGYVPWSHLSALDVLRRIVSSPPPSLDNQKRGFSQAMTDFVNQCLDKNPLKRATVSQLLDHKFLKQARDAQWLKKRILDNLPPVKEGPHSCGRRSSVVAHECDWPASDMSWDFSSVSKTSYLQNYAGSGSPESGTEDEQTSCDHCCTSDLQSQFSQDLQCSLQFSETDMQPTSKSSSQDLGCLHDNDVGALVADFSDSYRTSPSPCSLEPIREVASATDLVAMGDLTDLDEASAPSSLLTDSTGAAARCVQSHISCLEKNGKQAGATGAPTLYSPASAVDIAGLCKTLESVDLSRSKSLSALEASESPFSQFKDIPFYDKPSTTAVADIPLKSRKARVFKEQQLLRAAITAFQKAGKDSAVRVLTVAAELGNLPAPVAVQLAAAAVDESFGKKATRLFSDSAPTITPDDLLKFLLQELSVQSDVTVR